MQLTPMDMMLPSQNRQTPVTSTGAVNLDDPSQIDWGALAQEYSLTPEQVQILQIPAPAEGPSLGERLERMRTLNTGGLELKLEDNGISGSLRF